MDGRIVLGLYMNCWTMTSLLKSELLMVQPCDVGFWNKLGFLGKIDAQKSMHIDFLHALSHGLKHAFRFTVQWHKWIPRKIRCKCKYFATSIWGPKKNRCLRPLFAKKWKFKSSRALIVTMWIARNSFLQVCVCVCPSLVFSLYIYIYITYIGL